MLHPVLYLNTLHIANEQSNLLGTHTWEVGGDNVACNDAGKTSYTTELTLSACENYEYICKDGSCVSMNVRCDGKTDCEDKSDEMDCVKVSIAPSYNKIISLPAIDEMDNTKMDVYLTIGVNSILSINEIDQLIYISHNLIMEWYDPRLQYQDIKDNIDLNVMS